MAKPRIKMEGQLAEDFSKPTEELTATADETADIEKFLNDLNISGEEYEAVKAYLYDNTK